MPTRVPRNDRFQIALMSDLLGAWSLGDESVDHLLGRTEWDHMVATLFNHPHRRVEFNCSIGRLVAVEGRLVQNGRRCIAIEGCLATRRVPKQVLEALLARPEPPQQWSNTPDGHFVLAHADGDKKTLTILRGLLGGAVRDGPHQLDSKPDLISEIFCPRILVREGAEDDPKENDVIIDPLSRPRSHCRR